MRVDLMWWRAWETPLLLGFLAVFAVGSDWQEWYEVAFLAGGFATAGWLAYRTTLTVEADHDGVSFHRWHGPVHRYRWREIAAVTVTEQTYFDWDWGLKRKWYSCALVLEGRPAVRIDAGNLRRSRRDAELLKQHIDQVRQRWDRQHIEQRNSPPAMA